MKHPAFRIVARAAAVIALSLMPLSLQAQFVVHSAKGKIAVVRNGAEQAVNTGADCERNDMFKLGEGASISLLNKITNKIYSADGPGEMTVSHIVAHAMNRSKSHASNVVGAMNFGRNGTKSTTVYEQNGMVRRSQAVLDPEAYSVNVEPEALAIAILNSIGNPAPTQAPLQVITGTDNGLSFKAKSTDESPVYFNIIKFRTSDGKPVSADISELGQPVNAYILQPQQELMREQPEGSLPGELHLLVATPFGYDVDSLLDILEEQLESGIEIPAADPELLVYIFPLNQI